MIRRAGADSPFASERPLVFAHRGGAGLAPENTLVAMAEGLRCGADGIECDIRLSADGVPMVVHDPTLDRTTDHRGAVAAFTAAALARVDAGYAFGPEAGHPWRGRGVGVPTLAAVLEATGSARLILEVKDATAAAAAAVVAAVRRADAVRRACVGSFHRVVIDTARQLAPDIATSASEPEARRTLLLSRLHWPLPARRPYVAFQIPEVMSGMRVLSPSFVRRARREGARVQVWVVDDAETARRLLDWGVDDLITDRPDCIVPICRAWQPRD